MNPNEEEKKIIDSALKCTLNAIPNLIAVYLFGSFATGQQTKMSDIDLAILPEEPVDPVELWRLSQHIASSINLDVEIIDLLESSTVFRYQVITTGKCIYCSNRAECDSIENRYISMYLRLNEERKDIIKDYMEKKDG